VSAKNKWKKQIPSDASSFRRPKGSARPGSAILIVTEGLVSEPAYFTALKRRLALQTLEIEVQPGGMGDPQKLVEYAVGLREARRCEARNGTLSLSKALDFDEMRRVSSLLYWRASTQLWRMPQISGFTTARLPHRRLRIPPRKWTISLRPFAAQHPPPIAETMPENLDSSWIWSNTRMHQA
jgi:hypothetical protein